MALAFILFFILGALAGSFLNVVVFRRPRGQSAFKGRSHCPHCRKALRWFELVPFFSFLLQGGRCRRCQKPIGWADFGGEFLTALVWGIFGALLIERGELGLLVILLPLISLLTLLFLYDARHQLLPDQFVAPSFLLALIWAAVRPFNELQSYFFPIFSGPPADGGILTSAILAGLVITLALFVIFLLTRGRGLGLGDVKLAPALGLLVGWPAALDVLLLAFVVGAITGIMLIASGRKALKSPIAFGPFLIGAALFILALQLYG